MQRHAARFTTGNYYWMNPGCVTNMVTQLRWDLLEHRRAKDGITIFYEIINNLASIPVYLQLKVHDSNTRGSASHKFRQLNTKWSCYKYSFLPATIVLWNALPLEVCQLTSLEQFHHALSQISLSSLLYQWFWILKYYIYIDICLNWHFAELSALQVRH